MRYFYYSIKLLDKIRVLKLNMTFITLSSSYTKNKI